MTTAVLKWLDLPPLAMEPCARLRLFRNSRMAAAAIVLAAFPLMTLLSGEPVAVAAGLLLAGALPAAIALDLRQSRDLDRAIVLGALSMALVLTGAVLRGLPWAPALALVGIVGIEALMIGASRSRTGVMAIVAATAVAMIGSSVFAHNPPTDSYVMPWAAATLAMMQVSSVIFLVHGMQRTLARERQSATDREIRLAEIEAMTAQTIVIVDGSGAVLRLSANAQRVLGLPEESLRARGLTELVLVSDRPALLTAFSGCARGAVCGPLRIRMRTDANDQMPRYRWIEIAMRQLEGSEGRIIAALRDITAEIVEEERLAFAAKDADMARNVRASFLATVSHELRTPLNAIIGFSEVLANPATAPKAAERVQEYARLIHGAGRDLLRIVTAMIDITRLDSGVYEFEAETADLKPLVETVVEAFRQEPESLGATFAILCPEGGFESELDQRAFRSVLLQLLSNAAKFGANAGPVTVELSTDGVWNRIAVTDRGPGIAPEKLAILGRHFERLEEGLSREHGGIGLGLSLARSLMALHNGQVTISSAPAKGTTVTLALPRTGASQQAAGNIHPLARPVPSPKNATPQNQDRRIA